MEERVKLSNAVERYALGGFVRLRGGVLKLYEDKIALSRLAGSIEIPLSELEQVRPTKIIGFLPFGLEFKKKSGELLRVYLTNFFTAASNREKWLMELERYAKRD